MTRILSRDDHTDDHGSAEEADSRNHPHRRRYGRGADKLLTLDRALLAGIFAAGAWYATTDLRAGNVNERVIKLEERQERIIEQRNQDGREYGAMTQQLREQDRRLEGIEQNLQKLADATARLANAVRDPR